MSLYVYTTKECDKDIEQHALKKEVDHFKERLYSTQRTSFFDNFPPPYLKKRFKRQQRLIAGEYFINGDIVICFYRILIRGNKEYGSFLTNPKKFGDEHFKPLISEAELEGWLDEQKKTSTLPSRQELNLLESEFLWGLSGQDEFISGDTFIYESNEWIKVLGKDQIKKRLILLPEHLIRLIDETAYDQALTYKVPDLGTIIYRKFPSHKTLFIIGIANNKEDEAGLLDKYKDLTKRAESDLSIDEIIRNSFRSYPAIILADPDAWIDVVSNVDYNLALSPEESELLKSAFDIDAPKSGFPLFINGRAGSGKSTLLQYIFTDYLKHYISGPFNKLMPPIFLTYSKSLADKCLNIVTGLLKYNYRTRGLNETMYNDRVLDILRSSILEFLPFLLSKVPKDDATLFNTINYIDYARFKNLWNEHFAQDPNAFKEYGPDISWHIIRSYIKGISIDGYLDLEEYGELPRNERNVTDETFKKVYEKVWLGWYKDLCEIQDQTRIYWDSQDLVKYLLDQDLITPKSIGIFCDEAQDFTRIELEMLFRLSLFSERNIDSNTLKRVPFAFAGDPFQTLNPTGFRWGAIKSSYVEKFIHSLTPELYFGNPELNYHELSYNYRSSSNIVKLSNNIQLFRSVIFDHQGINPQKSWHVSENAPLPIYFLKDDPSIEKKINEQSDIAIIIPCNEGEEASFVSNDDFLNRIIERDDVGIPRNVFSPMRAKGLEFQRVLIYGFGENKPSELGFHKGIDHLINIGSDKKITVEYFINQLYVAISRAQKRLFVLDSKAGFDSLWKYINDSSFLDELISHCNDKLKWDNELGTLTKGTENSWTEDKEDPLKLAEERESEGKLKNDPYLLRQAAMLYKNGGNNEKESECKALALIVEEKYDKAGDLLFEIGQFEKSLDAYWKGGYYKKIAKFVKDDQKHGLSSRFETRISYLIESPKGFTNISPLIADLIKNLQDESFIKSISTDIQSWNTAINQLLSKNLDPDKNLNVKTWKADYQNILQLKDSIIRLDVIHVAVVALNADDYKNAIKYFEEAGETRSKRYMEAKSKFLVKSFPEGLENMSDSDKKFLAETFKKSKDYSKAIEVYRDVNDSSAIFEILEEDAKNSTPQGAMIISYLELLIMNSEWSRIVEFYRGLGKTHRNLLIELKENHHEYLRVIVKEAATSAILPTIDNKIKGKVSDLFKDEFIEKGIRTWKDKYHPLVVGAAMERAGREIDCLKYYEKIAKLDTLDEPVRKNAEIRWIVVKEKQANREEKNNLKEIAAKHRNEALIRRKEMNWLDYNEPEFPNVAGLLDPSNAIEKETINAGLTKFAGNDEKLLGLEEPGDNNEIMIDKLRIKVNRSQKRINLEHLKTLQTASIFVDRKDCQSFDVEIEKEGDQLRIEQFKLLVNFEEDGVSFKSIENGITMKVQI